MIRSWSESTAAHGGSRLGGLAERLDQGWVGTARQYLSRPTLRRGDIPRGTARGEDRVTGHQGLGASPHAIREIRLLWLAHDRGSIWPDASRSVDPIGA